MLLPTNSELSGAGIRTGLTITQINLPLYHHRPHAVINTLSLLVLRVGGRTIPGPIPTPPGISCQLSALPANRAIWCRYLNQSDRHMRSKYNNVQMFYVPIYRIYQNKIHLE